MNWELYEVWSVDEDGHEDLIDTTKSLKEAREIAKLNLNEEWVQCIVYAEGPEGELIEIERVK